MIKTVPRKYHRIKWFKEKDKNIQSYLQHYVNHKNEIGVHIAEIELDESCSPYEYFMLNRFSSVL
mgnify:CR=1 FL=1